MKVKEIPARRTLCIVGFTNHKNFSVPILIVVFLLVAVRQMGDAKAPIWQVMPGRHGG